MNCCLNCGKEIPLASSTLHKGLARYKKLRFCGQSCSNRYTWERRRPARKCEYCSASFTGSAKRKYCSPACYAKAARKPRPERYCETCGTRLVNEEWGGAGRLRKQRFCGMPCYRKAQRINIAIKVCSVCGSKYTRGRKGDLKWFQRSRFCSQRCRGIGLMGDANPRWKGGSLVGYRRKGKKPAHRAIAEDVLGRALNEDEIVHHINLDKIDNDPLNLLVLTPQRHSWLHHELGKRYMQERGGVLPDDLLALGIWLGGVRSN